LSDPLNISETTEATNLEFGVQLALQVHDAATYITPFTETLNYVDDGTLTDSR